METVIKSPFNNKPVLTTWRATPQLWNVSQADKDLGIVAGFYPRGYWPAGVDREEYTAFLDVLNETTKRDVIRSHYPELTALQLRYVENIAVQEHQNKALLAIVNTYQISIGAEEALLKAGWAQAFDSEEGIKGSDSPRSKLKLFLKHPLKARRMPTPKKYEPAKLGMVNLTGNTVFPRCCGAKIFSPENNKLKSSSAPSKPICILVDTKELWNKYKGRKWNLLLPEDFMKDHVVLVGTNRKDEDVQWNKPQEVF